jgi:hypothetical protein
MVSAGKELTASMRSVVRMRSVLGIACALALGGCSGWLPSWDLGISSGGGGAELRLESDPPGAEARTSTGQGCRTPCAVVVPAASQSVTFTLPGFIAQTVPVQVRLPADPRVDPNALSAVDLIPNPVAVALEQEPPPVRRRPPPKRRAQRPPPPALPPLR